MLLSSPFLRDFNVLSYIVCPCYHYIRVYHLYDTPSLQAVDIKYAEANALVGSSQKMVFKGEKITLDIPLEGIVLENGWAITPLALPEVSLFRNTSQYVTVGVLIKVILP